MLCGFEEISCLLSHSFKFVDDLEKLNGYTGCLANGSCSPKSVDDHSDAVFCRLLVAGREVCKFTKGREFNTGYEKKKCRFSCSWSEYSEAMGASATLIWSASLTLASPDFSASRVA